MAEGIDYTALIKALSDRNRRQYETNPYLLAGNAIEEGNKALDLSGMKPWEKILARAASGFAGGAARGYGLKQAETQEAESTAGLAKKIEAARARGEGLDATLQADPEYSYLAPYAALNRTMAQYQSDDAVAQQEALLPIEQKKLNMETESRKGLAKYESDLATGRDFARIAAERALSPNDVAKLEDDARKEIRGMGAFERFEEVYANYKPLKEWENQNTRAADLAIIASYARILDPGSTVREGEIQITRSASPFVQSIIQQAQSEVTRTGTLGEKTRQELISAARVKVDGFRQDYEQQAKQAGDTYTQRGAREKNVYPIPLTPEPAQAAPRPSFEDFKRMKREGKL